MSKHGLNLCFCGVHVPQCHIDAHTKKSKHKDRIVRRAKTRYALPTKKKRGRRDGNWRGRKWL